MEMDAPFGTNALDAEKIVGKPLDRIDGRLKVTGGAHYAYETQQSALYGFVVEASIAKGRIVSIETLEAERSPGVRLVLTYRNARNMIITQAIAALSCDWEVRQHAIVC